MDPDHLVHFGHDPYGPRRDWLVSGAVRNSSGYNPWLHAFTIWWPDGEMCHPPAPYVTQVHMPSAGQGNAGVHSGNGDSSPWSDNWGSIDHNRTLFPYEPHWLSFDFSGEQTPDMRVLGLPLSPRRQELLDSTVNGYHPATSSGNLNDNILHPDQFNVLMCLTFSDTPETDCDCPLTFSNFQKGPYIHLNSPAASGELPNGLGEYLMRPSHLEGHVGVPVTSGGPVSGTLVVDVTAFDRDYGDSAPDGQGIREVALWVEGPENEQSGHSSDYNLLRSGNPSERRDWYYLTASPYRVEFDLQQWPDGSYVMTGTHYLYVRAMDRDDDEGLDQLFTLLVVPFEVEPSGVSCDDLVAGDEVLFIQITDSNIYRNAFSDSITNTSDYPVTLNEMIVHWPKGTSGVDGLYPYPNPYINVVYRWDEAGSYSTAHYGNGHTDPWHVTSGWRSATYREIPEGERRLFSNRFDGLYYVNIGDILGLPYNPWHPDYRMAPPASYVSYSRNHSLYNNWRRAYALGGNIVHPSQFELEMRFDFPAGLGSCWLTFDDGRQGPAIQLLSPGPTGDLSAAYPHPWYVRPEVVAGASSVPAVSPDNVIEDVLTILAEAGDLDFGGGNGAGIQEVAFWVVGPNSRSGYRNLLVPYDGAHNWQRDWAYVTSPPYQSFAPISLPGTWPGGRTVVNGTHYLFVRAMDTA
ncbi:MAG: hypothetical protein E3J29_01665, partial [Dehalococcoidia bacterium]